MRLRSIGRVAADPAMGAMGRSRPFPGQDSVLPRPAARALTALLLLAPLTFTPSAAGAQCLLCEVSAVKGTEKALAPLSIEIEANLDFDRVAHANSSGGSVAVDPATGNRTVTGGLVKLGGYGLQGSAIVHGEPGHPIRVQVPGSAILHSSYGGTAELTDIVVNLPPGARLGPDGSLRFSFGGRLNVDGDAHGDYRGQISLVVDYQ